MSRTSVCELHAVVSGHKRTRSTGEHYRLGEEGKGARMRTTLKTKTPQSLKHMVGNSSFILPDVSNREEFKDRGDIWLTILEEKKLIT